MQVCNTPCGKIMIRHAPCRLHRLQGFWCGSGILHQLPLLSAAKHMGCAGSADKVKTAAVCFCGSWLVRALTEIAI